jgi:hypothetical protein
VSKSFSLVVNEQERAVEKGGKGGKESEATKEEVNTKR